MGDVVAAPLLAIVVHLPGVEAAVDGDQLATAVRQYQCPGSGQQQEADAASQVSSR